MKISTLLRILLTLAILLILLATLNLLKRQWLDSSSTEISSAGPTVDQLQELSALVTTRIIISDILEGENSHYKGSWLVRGDALISVDLSSAELTKIDSKSRTAILSLPSPTVISARVNHAETKTFDIVKKKWFSSKVNESNLRDTAMKHAQNLIASAASKPEHIQAAQRQAERILATFYLQLGWEINILWNHSQAN